MMSGSVSGLTTGRFDSNLSLAAIKRFHRVEGIFREADAPEIEEWLDRAGVAGDGPCKLFPSNRPPGGTGIRSTSASPRTALPKTVGFVLER